MHNRIPPGNYFHEPGIVDHARCGQPVIRIQEFNMDSWFIVPSGEFNRNCFEAGPIDTASKQLPDTHAFRTQGIIQYSGSGQSKLEIRRLGEGYWFGRHMR